MTQEKTPIDFLSLIAVISLGAGGIVSAQQAEPPRSASPRESAASAAPEKVESQRPDATHGFDLSGMKPDEADALIGLLLHSGQVERADALLEDYYEPGDGSSPPSRTVVSYALEGQLALLRVQLGALSQLGGWEDPSELQKESLRVLRFGVDRVSAGIVLLNPPSTKGGVSRRQRIRGRQFQLYYTRLLVIRARLYMALGDAAYRIQGLRPPTRTRSGEGVGISVSARLEYDRATSDLSLAAMIRPAGSAFAVQELATRLDERQEWLRLGLPFLGHRLFSHQPHMVGAEHENWAVRPRLEELLRIGGELDQLHAQRVLRLERAAESTSAYLTRMKDAKSRQAYRRDRMLMDLRESLVEWVKQKKDDLAALDARQRREVQEALAQLSRNRALQVAEEAREAEIRSRLSGMVAELNDTLSQLNETATLSQIEGRGLSGELDLPQLRSSGKKTLELFRETSRELKDDVKARRLPDLRLGPLLDSLQDSRRAAETSFASLQMKLQVTQLQVEETRLKVVEKSREVEAAHRQVKAAVSAGRAKIADQRLETALRAVQDIVQKGKSETEAALRDVIYAEWELRKEQALALRDEAKKRVGKVKGLLGAVQRDAESVVREFKATMALINGYGAMIKGTGLTTISNLPDALMETAKLGLELKVTARNVQSRVRQIRGALDSAEALLRQSVLEVKKVDLAGARKLAEDELRETVVRVTAAARGSVETMARELADEMSRQFEAEMDAALSLVALAKSTKHMVEAEVRKYKAMAGRDLQAVVRERQRALDLMARASELRQRIKIEQDRLEGILRDRRDLEEQIRALSQASVGSEKGEAEPDGVDDQMINQHIAALTQRIKDIESGTVMQWVPPAMELDAVAQGRSILDLSDDYTARMEEANQLWLALVTWVYRVTDDEDCMRWFIIAADHFELRNAMYRVDRKWHWPIMRTLGTRMPRFLQLHLSKEDLSKERLGVSALEGGAAWYVRTSTVSGTSSRPAEDVAWSELATMSRYANAKISVREAIDLPARLRRYKPEAAASGAEGGGSRGSLMFQLSDLASSYSGGFLWDVWVHAKYGGERETAEKPRPAWGIEPLGESSVRLGERLHRLPIFPATHPDHAAKDVDVLAPLRQYRILRETLGRDQFHTFGRPVPGHNYPEYLGLGLDGTFRLSVSDDGDAWSDLESVTITMGYLLPGSSEWASPATRQRKKLTAAGAGPRRSWRDIVADYDHVVSAREAGIAKMENVRARLDSLAGGPAGWSTDPLGARNDDLDRAELVRQQDARRELKRVIERPAVTNQIKKGVGVLKSVEHEAQELLQDLQVASGVLKGMQGVRQNAADLARAVNAITGIVAKQRSWIDAAVKLADAQNEASLTDPQRREVLGLLRASLSLYGDEAVIARALKNPKESQELRDLMYLAWLTAMTDLLEGRLLPVGGAK